MIIIQGLPAGIGIKRGYLYGDTPYKIVTIELLLVRIVWVRGHRGAILIRQAVTGLMQDHDWLTNNAPSVRIARRKAQDYQVRKYQKYMDEYEERHLNERHYMRTKIAKLENENSSLRSSLVSLARGES